MLGSAAGGGVPQWNCNCATCRDVRSGTARTTARTQSSLAVSADGMRWCLINASPDLRDQILAFEPLWPSGAPRASPIAAVLLTDAGVDHVAGLLSLREGTGVQVVSTTAVHAQLFAANSMFAALLRPGKLAWAAAPEGAPESIVAADGTDLGLTAVAFHVPGRAAAYAPAAPCDGAVVGYRITDVRRGTAACIVPVVAELDARTVGAIGASDCLFLDGTFWSEDELARRECGSRSAADMGHLPIGGPHGSLARLGRQIAGRRIYTHLNNTNPVIEPDTPERQLVEAAGWEIATDGMEIEV